LVGGIVISVSIVGSLLDEDGILKKDSTSSNPIGRHTHSVIRTDDVGEEHVGNSIVHHSNTVLVDGEVVDDLKIEVIMRCPVFLDPPSYFIGMGNISFKDHLVEGHGWAGASRESAARRADCASNVGEVRFGKHGLNSNPKSKRMSNDDVADEGGIGVGDPESRWLIIHMLKSETGRIGTAWRVLV